LTVLAKAFAMAKVPIRIGIDLTPILPGAENGGAKFAALEFIKTLLNDFGERFHLTLFVPEIALEELRSEFLSRVDLECTRFGRNSAKPLGGAVEELKSQRRIRSLCRKKSVQVFYSPFGRFLSLPFAIPFIAQVHDLIHLDYPQTLPRKDRLWRHFNLLKLSLRRAIFQVSSEFTRQRLHAAYAVPLDRVERTYLPIHGRFTSEMSAREGAFFIYPARAWPHKNHENLLRAYSAYREKLGEGAWNLALTAGNDVRTARLRSLAASLGLGSKVQFLGEVGERELNGLYQSASALVFPSRYEGFGIPLVEAMYFGLPIICGRTGSQPEVAGDAALYVDVEDPQNIAEAMINLTEDRILQERLVAKGKRQLQTFVFKTEVAKLVHLFEEYGDVEVLPQPLQQIPMHFAIWCLDFLYAASALCLSIPIAGDRN
jgi:glycosyltransferase involved in cell wall biosynthesis